MVNVTCVHMSAQPITEKVTVTGAFSTSPHPQLGLVTSAQISCAALAVVRGVSTLRRLRSEERRVGKEGWAGWVWEEGEMVVGWWTEDARREGSRLGKV